MRTLALAAAGLVALGSAHAQELRGTGDLGIVVERAAGTVQIVDTTARATIARVEGLGDLSHASAVFSPDQRYAFVFGRDGGLTKVDLLTAEVVDRVVQSGNAIGGAISQDGRLVAVSNYEPGGVRVFAAADLRLVADIATPGKVVGLVDAPGDRFVFSLWDAGEIWIAEMSGEGPEITKFEDVGYRPYDALITPDGRWYLAGLFGEDGVVRLDLWHPERGPERILDGYGRGEAKLPVYKMPHLEGWAAAGERMFLPAVGRHELLVVDRASAREIGRVEVASQPVFAMARPDGRQLWVNFAHPDNHLLQVIDTETLEVLRTFEPGPAILHMEFTPRGGEVWVSVRDADAVVVYDTRTFERLATVPADKPSGVFFAARAHKIGL